MISALVLTKNEETDLPRCLGSLKWCDDVHVFDSFSDDGTVDVARYLGARVTQRAFDHYAGQRNAALGSLSFRHDWVVSLDADEIIPEALANEMMEFVSQAPPNVVAARMRRRDFMWGKWLRHAQISPYYIRLFRPSRVRYEREINEILVPDGAVADLREAFDHHPFSKGLAAWIERHNRYSSMEAARAIAERSNSGQFTIRNALFHSDFNVRRRHQKGIFYRLPGRPWLKFAYMLLWRRALFDGRPGIAYASLQAIYEHFIVIKERELLASGSANRNQ
ncbi:MAG TPA: glycosyltransferase family 2 protein [Tepidisphaeraceae bacterium]|nr:glycosyltransferase family 2 protein [Tepidisphaeraceae bacterium]